MKRALCMWLLVVGATVFAGGRAADPLLDGYRLYAQNQFDKAASKFEEGLGDPALRAEARYMLGRVLQMRGKWKEALEEFERLTAEHPESEWNRDGMIQQGQCCAALGKGEEAIARFEAARQKDPNAHVAVVASYHLGLMYLGVVKDIKPDGAKAQQELERVIKEDPDSEYALRSRVFVASIYVANNDVNRALDNYKQVSEMRPDSPWGELARTQAAMLYGALGRAEEMRREIALNRGVFSAQNVWQVRHTSPLQNVQNMPARWVAVSVELEPDDLTANPEALPDGTRRYRRPTIMYGNWVISSDRADVNDAQQVVKCTGNVTFSDSAEAPTYRITSARLDLKAQEEVALFEGDVTVQRNDDRQQLKSIIEKAEKVLLRLDPARLGTIELPRK